MVVYLGKATPASGQGGGSGEAVWGDITGTLSDQMDLADALSAKQDTLVSGTNIKTINDQSLLGSGNITISGSVPNQNIAVGATNPLEFWEGTSTEYNNGVSTTYYNWQNGTAFDFQLKLISSEIAFKSIAHGANKFITVANNVVMSTADDMSGSWASVTTGISGNWQAIVYGDKFIVTSNTDAAMYSSDGSTWMGVTMPSSATWKSLAYGNSTYVAIAYNSDKVAYSTDSGATWTESTMPSSANWSSVAYGGDKFVAIADSSNKVAYSTDGITWTEGTLPSSGNWISVAYGGGKFVAVINRSTIGAYSTDGINWTQITFTFSKRWSDVVYGSDRFLIISTSNNYMYSFDGINWMNGTMSINETYTSVAYGNGYYVVVAEESSGSMYSAEGTILTCYTTDENPTTESTVYSAVGTPSALTITSVGTGTITCSDTNTYTYNSSGNQTVTQTVGEAHPSWICLIEGVGIKKGSTVIASVTTVDQTYNASSTNAQSGVAVASGISDTLGTIETALAGV